MGFRNKVARPVGLFFVNHFLKGTHFFGAKRALLRLGGIDVGADAKVVGPLHIGSVARLAIGRGSWVGKNLKVDGNGSVVIGVRADVAPQVTFSTGGHEIGPHERRAGAGKRFEQQVGDGCWVGTHVVFVGDLYVGEGTVVAAGSVVTGDCPADVLVAGVPAVVKRALD